MSSHCYPGYIFRDGYWGSLVTMILVSTLFWFLNKTKTGKSMRAYSDNEDLALLSGIDPKKVVMLSLIHI